MIPVILESPYSGDVELNMLYLTHCIRDCLRRGETPYASHQMLTRALDDMKPEERKLGIEAGFVFHHFAERSVVYHDLGVSGGMALGILNMAKLGKAIEYRLLGGDWKRW